MSQTVTFFFIGNKGKIDKEKLKNLKTGEFEGVYESEVMGPHLNYRFPKIKEQGIEAQVGIYFDVLKKGEIFLKFYESFDEAFIRKIIDFIKEIYFILHLGGFGVNEYDGGEDGAEFEMFSSDTRMEDMSRIWSANLFTPEEVKKYGREKLLKAPSEFIEEWEDGAIFMMITKNNFASSYKYRKKLREYLGEKIIEEMGENKK